MNPEIFELIDRIQDISSIPIAIYLMVMVWKINKRVKEIKNAV